MTFIGMYRVYANDPQRHSAVHSKDCQWCFTPAGTPGDRAGTGGVGTPGLVPGRAVGGGGTVTLIGGVTLGTVTGRSGGGGLSWGNACRSNKLCWLEAQCRLQFGSRGKQDGRY